jgi:hypothetical protein
MSTRDERGLYAQPRGHPKLEASLKAARAPMSPAAPLQSDGEEAEAQDQGPRIRGPGSNGQLPNAGGCR